MTRPLLAGFCLLLASGLCQADMYLMARGKLEGTDLAFVNFLRDRRMPDRAACEAERRAGRTTGFQIFARVYVVTHRGFSAQLQTYCVESDQQVAPLPPGQGGAVGYTYLVDVQDGRFKLTPFDSLGQCNAAAGSSSQASEARFCARSNQGLRN